jgi:uroporphyrinogen III methyltransferase/synthase
VIYMPGNELGAAAAGLPPDAPAIVVSAGTRPGQRSAVTTVARLAEVALESPVLVIVGEVVLRRTEWFEKRPLFGTRVLVPRSREHHGKLAAVLDEAGAEPVEFTPASFVPAGEVPSDLSRFRAVHLGDPQSAEMLMVALRDARRLAGKEISAAGHFTASTLERWAIVADVVGPPSRGPVLWIGPGEIPAALDVTRATLYRETLRQDERERVQSMPIDAVAFPSSNSARRTRELFGAEYLRRVPLFSMGAETSAEIRRQGLDVAAEAGPSTFEGLVDVVVRHFIERNTACRASSLS